MYFKKRDHSFGNRCNCCRGSGLGALWAGWGWRRGSWPCAKPNTVCPPLHARLVTVSQRQISRVVVFHLPRESWSRGYLCAAKCPCLRVSMLSPNVPPPPNAPPLHSPTQSTLATAAVIPGGMAPPSLPHRSSQRARLFPAASLASPYDPSRLRACTLAHAPPHPGAPCISQQH